MGILVSWSIFSAVGANGAKLVSLDIATGVLKLGWISVALELKPPQPASGADTEDCRSKDSDCCGKEMAGPDPWPENEKRL